jgi:hypothetical protein
MAGGEFLPLPPGHWPTVDALEEPAAAREGELRTAIGVDLLAVRKELVGQVAVEDDAATEEEAKKGDARRQLGDDVDVARARDEEEMEDKVELPEMCGEDVEPAEEGAGEEPRRAHMAHLERPWSTQQVS